LDKKKQGSTEEKYLGERDGEGGGEGRLWGGEKLEPASESPGRLGNQYYLSRREKLPKVGTRIRRVMLKSENVRVHEGLR